MPVQYTPHTTHRTHHATHFQDKLKAALEKETQFQADALRHEREADDKKRKYNSMTSYEVTNRDHPPETTNH